MGEHTPVVLEDLADLERLTVLGFQGLLDFPLHHQTDQQADPHQQPEDDPPAGMGTDVTPHHRCHQRSQRHHQNDE